jgi:chromatin structure-remodeling complex subunit RSC3/30
MSEYHTLFTGGNLRWEVLALLFVTAGLSAILLGPTDPLLAFVGQQPSKKQAFIHQMSELGSSCLSFCTDVGHLNDFGIWVLHEHSLLVSQILGDAHYLTWRRMGDLATALFAMGLHQDIKDSPEVPFWLTEFRKRSVGLIYGLDKMLSVFLGRPPRTSHRYCSIVYPLDLDLEELDLEGPELTRKLASLDKVTGWNSDGAMRKSSHTRCFVIINRIREDILELSLGSSIEDVSATSADIARRNEQAWNDFPKVLKYYPEIWAGKRSAEDCVTTVIIYLDVVYNEFLLQRTLVRRVRAQSEALVRISRLLLTTVLAVVNNRSQCGTVGCDAAWMVVLYGLPASGVLALELLQQTQNRAQTTKDFPRSEVIQNLSVFVSCLGWIHMEGDGNYHLCIQARNMIQRILDRVLSPEATYSSQQTLPTPSNSDYTDEAMYDFSWMDNAQFDADFWSNLDFHPLLAVPESSM